MSLLSTDEQNAWREVLRAAFTRLSPGPDTSVESKVNGRMVLDELGVGALGVPEDLGGDGGNLTDLAVLFDEVGYSLFGGPVLPAVLSAQVLARCDAADCRRYLGEARLVAVGGPELQVQESSDGVRIDGTIQPVLDDPSAARVIVVHEAQAYAVPTAEVTRRTLTSVDLTRDFVSLHFSASAAHPLGTAPAQGWTSVAALAVAAEQAGGAARCVDDAVAFALARYQFGRPIGSFQAIKHRAADMAMSARSARLAVRHAARRLSSGAEDAVEAVAAARIFASAAYTDCAAGNLQLHGGMGFTWESDCHLHVRRALADATLFGGTVGFVDLLADRLLDRARTEEEALS